MFGIKKKEPVEEKVPKVKKSTKDFYVHDMLATFRAEKIPKCKLSNIVVIIFFHIVFKERHVHEIEHNKYKAKVIFKQVSM